MLLSFIYPYILPTNEAAHTSSILQHKILNSFESLLAPTKTTLDVQQHIDEAVKLLKNVIFFL